MTFSTNGAAYQISISFNESNFTNAVLVSKSSNGGASWGAATTLIGTQVSVIELRVQRQESITADPTTQLRLRGVGPARLADGASTRASRGSKTRPATVVHLVLAHDNGGATWEPARLI